MVSRPELLIASSLSRALQRTPGLPQSANCKKLVRRLGRIDEAFDVISAASVQQVVECFGCQAIWRGQPRCDLRVYLEVISKLLEEIECAISGSGLGLLRGDLWLGRLDVKCYCEHEGLKAASWRELLFTRSSSLR